MKKFVFAALLTFLIAGVAAAEDYPQVEVFGGYSIQRLGLPDISAPDLADFIPSAGSIVTSKFLKEGFDASFTYNATAFLGIEADFRYNSGNIIDATVPIESIDVVTKVKYTDFSFLAGPRFAVRKNNAVTPFAHVLFGFDRSKFTVEGSALGQSMSMDAEKDTGFGLALGGGIDVKVHKNLAIRLIQADYYLAKHEEETWNNLALAFGVVFRFGGK
jgi:opacity protein-like surface antigen